MVKLVLLFAAFSGAISVGLGAFGAHALKGRLEDYGNLSIFQTAVQYQFYHTIVLLFIGLFLVKFPSSALTTAAYSMMIGISIFSGTLYVLSIFNIKWLGAVTPLGGLALIVGWIFLFLAIWKSNF